MDPRLRVRIRFKADITPCTCPRYVTAVPRWNSSGVSSLEFLGGKLVNGREDRRHGYVDPNIDGAKFILHPIGGRFDGARVSDIGRYRQSPHAVVSRLVSCRLQPIRIARQ